ncbi:cell wall elongation regulator TseB-like domain-containing protein [Furfurilactobacillus siliginis]|uniref:Cell wall elongation regulator TseB-like domain-containing protein n=1 Tax=Furfurilactobacillus siliginis TaxID=348151 RepID=A0A0R2LBC6_9LACO|nr:DUF5590 domain-containing protein [Furfurilactobacillus siliginis]KRN96950.1 hypothetical protein IV55_GL000825 [Furfurilactobacillus siliginis]GEK27709.1 hypothetical protein LSI01_00200 [Furfurilactobacillus siliginis]
MQRQQHRRKNWSQIILWIVLAVALLVGSGFIVLHEALRPAKTAASQTVAIAKQKAGVNDAHGFMTYNRQQSYYAVRGHNKKKHPVYVVVAKSTGHVTTLRQRDGKSKSAILDQVWRTQKPQKVTNIGLGLRHGQPVWEVSYLNQRGNLCYMLLRYKDGSTAQAIQNL